MHLVKNELSSVSSNGSIYINKDVVINNDN